MPEDGIDFPETDDSPRFIEDKTLAEIAEKVRELITKHPDAYTRFRESVKQYEKRQRDQIAAQVKWERKRREHARRAIKKARLLDKDKDPPGDGWRFQSFRGQDVADIHVEGELSDIMAAWFPPKLCWQSRPKVQLPPLPPRDGEMEPCEKETALAAIHDYTVKGERKIADGLKLTHYKDLIGIESPVPGDSRHDGLVKQILVSDEGYLWIWLEQIEEDLQSKAKARTTTHSVDFRFVRWRGKEFFFTKQQAPMVKMLWDAWVNRTPDVGSAALLEVADAKTSRLVDGFRDHPAWDTMIIDGKTTGARRIAGDPPES